MKNVFSKGKSVGVLIALLCLSGCRAVTPAPSAAPSEERRTEMDSPAGSNDVALVSTSAEGRVVSVYVTDTGQIYWDGELLDADTLRDRLSALRQQDAVAWYGDDPAISINATQRHVLESLLKLSVPLVWVQSSPGAEASAGGASGRTVTVNTRYIREALKIYDELKGKPEAVSRLLDADVVLRFHPDAERGYMLKRVEFGLAGLSFWVVHESLNEAETATSIQFKKEW